MPACQQCSETSNECVETLKVQDNSLRVFIYFLPTDQSRISLTHLPQIMVSTGRHL